MAPPRVRTAAAASNEQICAEGNRRHWRVTRDIPSSWRASGRGVRSHELLKQQPSTAEIYGRGVRSVRPPPRHRPAPPGQAAAAAAATLDAHLQNEPVYVTALRNPMWKSAKAAAQAGEDARKARMAQVERERLAKKRTNAQKEKRQAEEMSQKLRDATRAGEWEQVQALLSWRSPAEGFKVDVNATDSGEGEQEPPVMVAARQVDVECVIVLVEAGAPPPQPDGLQQWEDDDESVMQKAHKLASIRTQLRELQKEESDAQKALEEGSPALAKAIEERDRLQQQLKEQEAEASKLSARQRRARRTSVEQMIEEYDIGADGIIDQLERKVANAKKVIKSCVMPIATATKRTKKLSAEWQLAFPKVKPPPPRALSPDKANALVETYTTIEKATENNKKRWELAARVTSIGELPRASAEDVVERCTSKNSAAAITEGLSERAILSQRLRQDSSVSATNVGDAPLLLGVAAQESVLVPAAPVYMDAKQHRDGSCSRAMKAVALAEANAVVPSREDFIALKGPSHLKAWSASLKKRGDAIEHAICAEAAITGRRAKMEDPVPPPELHRPIVGPGNPLRPGKRVEIAATTVSAWSGQLVRDADGIPRAFGVKSTPGTSPRRQPGFANPPQVRQRPATDGGSRTENRRRRLHELQHDRHDPAFLVDSITGERQQLGHGCTVPMWSPLAGGRRRIGSARSASSASSSTSSSRGGKLLNARRGAYPGLSLEHMKCRVD